MGRFFRLLFQLWLFIAFGALAAAATHYVQAGHVELTENVKQVTFALPVLHQTITLTLWQYTLAMLVIGAALTCIHFGFDAMRKTLTISRLNKQLQLASYSATSTASSGAHHHSHSPSVDYKTTES